MTEYRLRGRKEESHNWILLFLDKGKQGTAQDEPRILGGQECPQHAQPFQVILSNRKENEPDVQCGGVLIDKDWVLTAAHCDQQGDIHTWMGDYSLRDNKGFEQCITSVQKFQHPAFNPITHDSDLMLLKLHNSTIINQYVQPTELATEYAQPDTPCEVSGWGTIKSPQGTVVRWCS
ncbi:kallikrein-8-like [Crotalus adamanteus]|uniref:Kallikrein-8-like n=1 Tax=Crotalus adamanteus TaxID=8729 RepID=A0AAW1AY05_CROAD